MVMIYFLQYIYLRKFESLKNMLYLPSPMNISVWWNGGSILGMLLGSQIITGLFLSMYYISDTNVAFDSIVHIMRDVENGWTMRLIHTNGASIFFLFLYLHIGRSLYYQSYITNYKSWMVGVSIFLISMATAFLGYVLPWGQMSYWGATVITNLLSAIPYWGQNLVIWIWGGYSVGPATLGRFFSLHFILPFLILVLVLVHLIFLHLKGSTNPLGQLSGINKVAFHPYYTFKDLVGFIMIFLFMLVFCGFSPWLLMDPENFSNANSMITPIHIQPEWYFLFAYAILRSIPSKFGGVMALAFSLLILYFLPLGSKIKSLNVMSFNSVHQFTFWSLIMTFCLLTWLGACPIEKPYFMLAQWFTSLYFSFLLMLVMLF
uniref:Cytochrome b n=1 Tax=Partulina redfieldi TaxID=115954 RepID=A0A3S5HWS8_9EUPU|nr:cytochrome b [Partulina redfieldi]AZZ06745.1 cytochrome b [Partulina redfieldi]